MTLGQTTAGRDLKNRLVVLGALMLLGLLVLVIRLYRLQVTRGEEFVQKSVANFVKETRIPADRGMILDSRGEILVDNRPSFDVTITPAFCEHCSDEVIPQLATYLGWDAEQVAKIQAAVKAGKRNAPFQGVPVQTDLTREDSDRVKLDLLQAHQMDLPGVEVLPVPHRDYKNLFFDKDGKPTYGLAHVLGYMNEITEDEIERLNAKGLHYSLGDYIGRKGIERYFESTLRGTDGIRKDVVNARGETLSALDELLGSEREIAPVPGKNLVLSIDARLQEEAEQKFKNLAGTVVAIDVRTGFILAMLSRPAYDPNLLTGRVSPAQLEAMSKDPFQPMIFRATQQQYPPGSTFKPIAMLAGLRSGEYTAKTTFRCTGGYRLGNRTWRCFNERGHGLIDVKSAIRESCDAFFYHLGDVVGLDALWRTASELGLGKPTGIGVVAEVPGIMPSEEYYANVPGGYQQYMALNSAVGQGDDSMTPLQMLMAYTAIANGGTVFQPQVVKRVETVDGQVVQEFAPKVARHVEINPEYRQVLIDGMTAVVNEPGGTAYWARLKDIKMAGKTGTAQVRKLGAVRLKKEQIGYWERDNAWFIGFAPAEDPEIAVVTLSEHAGFGGSESAPVVAAVIQKYFDLKKDTLEVEASPIEPPEIRPRPPVFKAPPAPVETKEPAAPNPDVPDEAVLPDDAQTGKTDESTAKPAAQAAKDESTAKPEQPVAKPEEPAKKEEPVTATAPAGVH